MAVRARDEVTLTRVDVDETTQWHFWHDGEGAHVSERERPAEGEPVEGKNLLLAGDVIQLRDGEEVLASFSADAVGLLAGAREAGRQAAVEMFGGEAWIIGRDDEPNEGQVRRSLYVGADLPEGDVGSYSSVALTPFRPGEGYPGIGSPGVFLEQHGPIPEDRRLDNTTIRLNAANLWLGYNDASLEGASFPMSRLMSVLNNAPYVTSSASFVTDGPVTAPNGGAWAWATLTQILSTATPPAALSSDRTSLRVARAGLYLVTTKGVVYDAAPGDLVHLSLMQDGQADPRMNAQAAVQSNWDQVSGAEVLRLEPSQVLRLGYRCEQGGGSKVNTGATLCLAYLGA